MDFNLDLPPLVSQVISPLVPASDQNIESIYSITPSNWYTIRPYAFVLNSRGAQPKKYVVFLPINPNNVTITTHFATNLVTTLYGIIEEHSEVRYYDITISGTTGYAPKFVTPVGLGPGSTAQSTLSTTTNTNPGSSVVPGRKSFTNGELIPSGLLGGFAQQSIGTLNTIAGSVGNLLFGDEADQTGVPIDNSGYVAFHNFYRILQMYKKDASGEWGFDVRKKHPLSFLNYKDNTQYDCIPRTFTLVRSAESPMLYNYNIVLRAYNLRSVDATEPKGSYSDKLATLGLANVGPSIAYKMKDMANSATTAVAGVASLATGFGS